MQVPVNYPCLLWDLFAMCLRIFMIFLSSDDVPVSLPARLWSCWNSLYQTKPSTDGNYRLGKILKLLLKDASQQTKADKNQRDFSQRKQ